jgi:ribulose-phosphate 3-epimerase
MAILAPSILSADLSNLTQQIRLVEFAGADWIHCDIMDGHFVPNITFGPIIVNATKRSTTLPVDVHLMIESPDSYLESFISAGANHITIHQEAVIHLNRTIARIKELGAKAGVAINPSTPVEFLQDIAKDIDLVLIMSVNPGFGGQSFILNSIKKVKDAVKLRESSDANFLIEVDGGVDTHTAPSILEAGCDVFIAGTSIFKSDNILAATAGLKNLISNSLK